jgi:hypothetical protein
MRLCLSCALLPARRSSEVRRPGGELPLHLIRAARHRDPGFDGKHPRRRSEFAFKPDENTGWEILRERQLNHPGQLLFNGVISALLKSMVGARFDEYQRALNGVGSGEFENDDWYAQSCTPHMCTDEEVIVFLSGHDRKVFTAWKPPGEKILVWPVLNEWPEKAKSHLRAWAKKWK